jgi:GDP-L-fucose synthase
VNIGYGKATTIREVVEIILRTAGHPDAEIIFDASKPTTIPIRMVDTSKASAFLGFKPHLSLEEGIRDTVDWYKNVYLKG